MSNLNPNPYLRSNSSYQEERFKLRSQNFGSKVWSLRKRVLVRVGDLELRVWGLHGRVHVGGRLANVGAADSCSKAFV